MKEFNVTSETRNSQYTYKNDNIFVQGQAVKDATTGAIQSINGSCYRNNDGQQGDYFGNFNGYPQSDGTMNYDLSQMKRSDSNLVWDAIEDIEAEFTPVDE